MAAFEFLAAAARAEFVATDFRRVVLLRALRFVVAEVRMHLALLIGAGDRAEQLLRVGRV